MSDKRILIADADSDAVEQFRQALSPQWTVITVSGGNAALAEMKKQPCDVVVADLDLPEIDGAELLNRIRKEYSKTILFILATEPDKERVMKNMLGAHQFLSKPCDQATLKNAVERALALEVWVASNKMRDLIARVRTLPTVPSLYFEVLAALRSPSATTEQVGSIIAKDMAMMTKLLQVLNSAYFGLQRKITDPVEAVGILGFDAVKSMVMTLKLLSQYDKVKPVYFSIDRLWRHSTQVARSAKQLTILQTGDRAMGETAFTAGLMHDLGKIVLAANFDEQYRGVQSLAIKQQLPLWEVEKEIFGANHGEIGAYLLGLWGMPLDLLEASALHHNPSQNITKGFTPLTAVHVANAVEYETNPEKDGLVSAKIDEAYLTELGLFGQLDAWRAALLKGETVKPATKPKIVKTATAKLPDSKPSKPASAPAVAATKPADKSQPPGLKPLVTSISDFTPVRSGWAGPRRQWAYVAVVGGVSLFLVAWLIVGLVGRLSGKHQPGKAPAGTDSSLVVHARSTDQNVAENQAAPVKAPAPTPVAAVAKSGKSGKQLAFSDFKLQGIFFAEGQPSAIINGEMVHPNEKLAGARIVDIGRSSVTVEYQNQRRVLTLK